MKQRVHVFLLALALHGCASATSILPADVATALREQPMRRLETDSLLVYYPEEHREDALRIAERAEGCAAELRAQAKIHNGYSDQKMVILIPDVPFNNAFVAPPIAGIQPVSVIPTSFTLDFATQFGLPPDPSYIGCHEIVHYVHTLQISGVWGWLNRWLGDVASPHIGLDPWFAEGLATYYEGRLQPGVGRLAWPWWRGTFQAAYAEKRIHGGDLSVFQRPSTVGNHYLVGSHFIEFIAERYGEKSLWKLIERQGDSLLFPFAVALRWKAATGKSLPTLIDEFADAVAKRFPPRPTPAHQRKIRDVGTSARYAVAATGREALIVSDADQTTQLRIYQDGTLLRTTRLVDLVVPHTLVVANPILTSGLSFTADGSQLYFVAIDAGTVKQEARLLRYLVDHDRLEVVVPSLGGAGGGLSKDGSTYYYGYADGDKRHLAALDLTTKKARIVRNAEPQQYYDHARPSPDGSKIASAFFDGRQFVIQILDATTGNDIEQVAVVGAIHDPTWIDDTRLSLLAEYDGRFQAHVYDLQTKALTRVSDAPYLAFQPRVHGETVRFLNRKGWQWTLDEVPLPKALSGSTKVSLVAATQIDVSVEPAPIPASHDLTIHSDEPYSQLDNLFTPSFRVPFLSAPSEHVNLFGLQLAGRDRLGFHHWSLFGQYELRGKNISGGFEYLNSQLAPLAIRLQVQRIAWNKARRIDGGDYEAGDFRAQHIAQLSVERGFRSWGFQLGAMGLEELDPDHGLPQLQTRRLVGPKLALQYSAAEGTAYSGLKRGVFAQGSAAHFNEAISSFDTNLSDFRTQVGVALPLPLSHRHTFQVSLRGRRLYGFDRDASFLVVGGSSAFSELWKKSDKEEPDEARLPWPSPLLEFQEPVRGFEDLAFTTDRIAIADLTYKYPLILDYGFASFAYLLPSLHFRQINLELFASGATDSFASFEDHRHLAIGTSVALSMTMWLVPMQWQYQLAQRFTDDDALVHSMRLGFAL